MRAIAEVFADGSCRLHQFVQLRATDARDRASMVVVVDGAEPAPPEPSNPQRWLSIAAEDDLLADALTYFGRGDDWFDTYKALECLELKFGGEREGQVERFRAWVGRAPTRSSCSGGLQTRDDMQDRSLIHRRTQWSGLKRARFCASSSAKAVMVGWESTRSAELNFLVLFEIVHIEVAVGFEPVLVGLDG